MKAAAPEAVEHSSTRGHGLLRTPVRWLQNFLCGLSDAVAPQTCCACAAWIPSTAALFCDACRDRLDELSELPACLRCGRALRPESLHDRGCSRCERESFWNVAGVVRLGPDVEPLRGMLRALKYAGQERIVEPLCDLVAAGLRNQPWWAEVDLLVPVPMHRLRRWQRPCDHAELLARGLSQRLHVPARRAAVRRVRYAPSQTLATTRAQRFDQVHECFGPARRPNVTGRCVCIVDNLLVSGATICEVSKVLRRAGARRMYAAVVARTVLHDDPDPFMIAADATDASA